MKKILPVSLATLALAAAGAAVYVTQKPKLDAKAASLTSGYLPAQTLALLSLPDPGQTAEDWKTTDLYKIWTEPQVQAFFAKPLSKVPTDKTTTDTWAQVQHLHPKNLFVALTALDDKDNQPHVVAGFEFDGTADDVNKLLTGPKGALRQKYPAGKADLQQYQGHAIESFDTQDGTTIASTFVDKWYLVGNDVAVLKATVDRIEGRAAGDATLEKDADFQTVSGKLPRSHATFLFARTKVFMDKIYALTAASGQTVDPVQKAEADKFKAIGATTTIEKGKFRDTVYLLAPGHRRPDAQVALSALPLTSADTLLYFASALNLPEHYRLPTTAAGSPGAAIYEGLGQFVKGLEDKGITLEKFRAAFGRELTVQSDWPANSTYPTLVASLDVHDPAAAGKFVDGLTDTLKGVGSWQEQKQDGLTLHVLSSDSVKFLSPAYTLTDKHLLLGLSAPGVTSAVKHEKSGGQNFTGTQAYKDSVATVNKGTDAVGYIDARAIFERAYGALKPMAALSTMMAPQSTEYVDVSKLPEAETISKHLTPIVYSQSGDDQGMLIESVGPVTFFQAELGLGGAAGAAAVPILQKQFGMFGAKPGQPDTPGEDAPDAPDSEPESAPSGTP